MAERLTIETYGLAPHNRLRNAWPILLFALQAASYPLLPTFVLVTYIKQLVFLPGFAPDMNRSLPTFLIVVRGLFLYLLILMHARLLLNHFPLYRLGVLYFNYS